MSHRIEVVLQPPLDYALYEPVRGQQLIDATGALEACGDWAFIAELWQDLLGEANDRLRVLTEALNSNNHHQFREEAHAIKGSALNLRLPALANVCMKLEAVGRQLEQAFSANDRRLLELRDPLLQLLLEEYQRVQEFLPEVQRAAAVDQPFVLGESSKGYEADVQKALAHVAQLPSIPAHSNATPAPQQRPATTAAPNST